MKPMKIALAALLAALTLSPISGFADEDDEGDDEGTEGKLTLIHMGDIHGHLVPRANVRSDSTGKMEGGLARLYTKIQKIREESEGTSLLINTGDTLQGSGEALFTRGQAIIDVLNLFKIDANAVGNWDFLYGTTRFEETFKGSSTAAPLAPWGTVSSNLYYTTQFDSTATCGIADASGNKFKRVLPPYSIKQVGNLKVGIIGFTTARAIAAVGATVTSGYQFTDGKTELPCYINTLRNDEKVDVVVMISELEMSRDIQLAETYPGVDVILNSDMHEKTIKPIVASTGTIIVEEGQDGTMLGELELEVENGKVSEWEWKAHIITSDIKENSTIAAKVDAVRKPFLSATFVPGQQVTIGGNTTTLFRPVNEVIAKTNVAIHRSNFMDEDMPGVVEGSSHNLIADAMRWAAGGDAAAIRGFRYGTHIPAGGSITMEDIFHFIPVVAKLGKSPKACGADLKLQIEQSSQGTFSPDPTQWAGGWMFGYSNVSFDFDACDGFTGTTPTPIGTSPNWGTFRGTNITVSGAPVNIYDTYNAATASCTSGVPGYTVAGYWFKADPTTINNCAPCRGRLIQVVTNSGQTLNVNTAALPNSADLLDVTEALVKYLRAPTAEGGLNGLITADNLKIHRIHVKRLPTINPFGFRTVQPLLGANAQTCPAL